MSQTFISGVSGLTAFQRMLDVAGNNLANLETTGFKSSRVRFSDLLSQTIREATRGEDNVGGTNPQQVGSGVQVASIDRQMLQGDLMGTGNPLDLAIEGEGFFMVSNGTETFYSRTGAFAIDSEGYLVDSATGYRVQRVGTTGEDTGIQDASSSSIYVPYDAMIPGQASTILEFSGNLSAGGSGLATSLMRSGITYHTATGTASTGTLLADLTEASGLTAGDTVDITGTDRDGNAVTASLVIDPATTTMGDLVNAISTAFPGSVAYLSNGEIYVTDENQGFSSTEVTIGYTGAGSLDTPSYFSYLSVGGNETRTTSIEVYDSQGSAHVLSMTFVRQDDPNEWDLVVNSISKCLDITQRRIQDITFDTDGSFLRIGATGGTVPTFEFVFDHAPGQPQTVELEFGATDGTAGLTQFAGSSTAVVADQDGYEPGSLSSISVTQEGNVIGVFTNGQLLDIATLGLATFRNTAGLTSVGNNYYRASGNSGTAVITTALSGGAGAVRSGVLETSNVDMAREFVELIKAQRGFQANARTITIADNILHELANLIR